MAELLDDLSIFSVDEDGDLLCIDLYGGESCACIGVELLVDADARVAALAQLRAWTRAGELVTLSVVDDVVSITSTRALLATIE